MIDPMRSPIHRVVAVILLACCQLTAAPTLQITTDRPDALYSAGEPVTFRIALKDDAGNAVTGQPLAVRLTKDGGQEIASQTIQSATEPVEVTGTLPDPGFLRCDVTHKPADDAKPITAAAGAGIDPTKIPPSLPPPDDFHAYWQEQKQLLKSEPAKPQFTPVDSTDPEIEAFDVQINCPGGAPVSGYLARPKAAAKKSLPAILYPHSAGVRSSDLPHAIKGAQMGLLAFDFNAHGLPNGKDKAFYEAQANGPLKGYPAHGLDDRETLYFRGMILRLMRAMDFLTSLPEWDGRILIVEGSSQGGGQALIAAGIDPRVTLCLASVPAMCDHTGFAADRPAGWPKLIPRKEGKWDEQAIRAARYVDAMNFARSIKCPTIVSAGFIDGVCPPTSVYAAFNAIPAKRKRIVNRPGMGHAFPPDLIEAWDQEIKNHITRMRAAP